MTPLGLVREALAGTLSARTARASQTHDHTFELPDVPWRRRRGGLAEPAIQAGIAIGKQLWRQATKDLDLRHMESEGVIDFAGRRYMLDHGSFARLYADGREWSGRSGRAISTLPAQAPLVPTPLWLLDALRGAAGATDRGPETVRGEPCRHIGVEADLGAASKATPGGLPVPAAERFEDLLVYPIEVWVGDGLVRRMRVSDEYAVKTVELWDFGIDAGELDWTRLPTFRSPDEAAQTA